MVSKNNVLYYTAGTLAALTLLASGVFAVAPYAQFLAPVAALSVGLPFIIGCAVFSVVTIALSYKAISKNKTISEKETQLAEKDAEVQAQKQTISEKDVQLAKEEDKVQAQKQNISEKDALLIERDTKIEEDALKVAIADGTVQVAKGAVNGAVSLTKGAANVTRYLGQYVYNNYVPSIESTKGTLSGIGGGLKNTYDASIASVRGALNSVGSSLYSRLYGTKVSSKEQFKREDGSKPSMQELTHLGYLDLAISSSQQEKQANNLDSLDLATSKNLNHLKVEVSSPGSQPAEKEETKVSGYFNQIAFVASQATKAIPYLAMSYLPYVFYNYATTPVSASFDDVNVTQPFVTDSSITSPVL